MSNPNPGWYTNQRGQQQWWDGTQWGALAPRPRAAKESGIAYLLAILLGGFAGHRFYLGSTGSAVAFLILWWGGWALTPFGIGIFMLIGAGIWWVIDLFMIPGMVQTANTRPY